MRCVMLLVAALLFGAAPQAEAGEAMDAAARDREVRDAWLPTVPEIVYWHWQKGRLGPALTGNESWHHFLSFVERELNAAGVVDVERNAWTFDRWQTSQWPDDSRWSLTIAGRSVPVASFGANSGSTGAEGVTAPLVLYEPGAPPERLAGKIVVMRTRVDPAVAERQGETDYEYQAPPGRYPMDGSEAGAAAAGGETPVDEGASVSWRIFPQLMQTRELITTARAADAAGLILVFDANRELAAGLYTFPVPARYHVPTLILDRAAGAEAVRGAEAGRSATLRLEADVVASEAYQLIGFLPGRNYGAPDDEIVQLVTHTDGPAISQDNGALGLLALIRYFARVPVEQRARTLMVYLDCRHFMPGQEAAFADEDYFVRHPDARDGVVAVVGMEHLGQIEYREHGERLVPTGRIDPSMIWTTDDERLLAIAIEAVQASGLPSAAVRNVARPGVHGKSQGAWYGMANPVRAGGRPAVAIMGTMGGYWATSAGTERLDPVLFRRQVATFVHITQRLMTLEID